MRAGTCKSYCRKEGNTVRISLMFKCATDTNTIRSAVAAAAAAAAAMAMAMAIRVEKR